MDLRSSDRGLGSGLRRLRDRRLKQPRDRAPGDAAGETAVRLLDRLPVRAFHGARRRPLADRMTQANEPRPEDELVRARQRDRARIMAWLLGGLVFLLFLITL